MSEYRNQVKLMCYNIFYQEVEERSEQIQELISNQNPDVLLLQEVSVSWLPYLKTFMKSNGYSYYGYGRHGGELNDMEMHHKEQFTPILWKTEKYELKDKGHFWLSSTPGVYSANWTDGTVSKFPRCVNWVVLQDKGTGGSFMALCIHTDPENMDVRTKSSQLTVEMADTIRKELPVILGGDWNMLLEDAAYLAVTEAGYSDVRFVAEKTMHMGSFNAWGKRTEDNYAFGDYLFVSPNVKADCFEVLDDRRDGVHISDHCPLMAVLEY